jgi:hypothetical protein
MLDASISFDITPIPGIKNMIFGADGIFLVALTGPGRVCAAEPAAAQPCPRADALLAGLPRQPGAAVEGWEPSARMCALGP